MEDKDIREKAKALGIKSWHVKKIDKLQDEIVDLEDKVATPVVAEVAAEEIITPEPIAEADRDNPDAGALAQRQDEASMEARMKALEDRVVEAEGKNRRLEGDLDIARRTMAKTPQRAIPERPNPNIMVYHEDQKKDGKYFGKQVSPEKAKQLYGDGYADTPADLPPIESKKT